MNTYQMYLVADMVTRRLARVGVEPLYLILNDTVKASVSRGTDGRYLDAAEREHTVAEFLTAFPDSTLTRETPYYSDRPKMTISGTTNLGIQWEIDFGTGVCERVQVGTKTVQKFDPEQLASVRKVTVQEPVYEFRCPDPIIAAGLVVA